MLFRFRNKKLKNRRLMVDEVLFDAENLAGFDMEKMEGDLGSPVKKRVKYFILGALVITLIIFTNQLVKLQIVYGEEYFNISEGNRIDSIPIFSERGIIYDRNEKELAWNIANDEGEPFYERKYTDLPGFSHVLGFVGYPTKDSAGFWWREQIVGRDGIEKIFNETLEGENGRQLLEVKANQQIFNQSKIIPAENGENIVLSIDADIQAKLFESIKNHAENFGFVGGSGIIMDIETGEIIALTNYPEYNSNVITDGKNSQEIENYFTSSNKPFLNRASAGLYTPGSIIKPFIAVAALNENIITDETTILSTGQVTIQNPYNPELSTSFRDWQEEGHGVTDVEKAIAESVNTFFYAIGGGYRNQKGLGISVIDSYLNAFMLGEPTGFALGNESRGTIPSPSWKRERFNDSWRLGDTYITSIGQFGFLVSPLQITRAIGAIASGGDLVTPTIIKGAKPNKQKIGINILPDHYETVRAGMRQTVTDGTASSALNISDTNLAVKTGTAQVGNNNQFINSWVVGFFPADKPKYSFVVLMERGPNQKSTLGASWVFRELVLFLRQEKPYFLKGQDEEIIIDQNG